MIKILLLGFRMHEVLTLAEDCWRDEDGRASLVYDIEKKGLGARKIIPTVARAMIRDAVDTLGRLCEPARERARQLRQDPDRIPLLVRYDPTALLGTDQLAPALGLANPNSVHTFLNRWAIMPVGKRPGTTGLLWRVDDIERGLRPLFPRHGYTLDHPDGTQQPLERFLCVVPYHLATGHPLFLRVRPLSVSDVQNFLAGEGRVKSVFARYGLCDADGQPWRIHAHQIRHWLTTVAHQGGLPEADLARWMGRDVSQNRVYEHLTSEQRVERIKAGIREGRILGPIADIFHRLPPEEREEFLSTAIEAAHATAHGICVHNFAVKPCDKYLQCLLNCGDLLRTKGDQREIDAITVARGIALRVVQRAEIAEREQPGAWPEAAQWVESCRRTIAGADRALAIEMDPGIPDGARVAVFPGAPSRAEAAR